MVDELKNNGRQPQQKMEDDLNKKWKTTSTKIKMEDNPQKILENKINKIKFKKMEDDLKKNKNLFLIPLKFRGKPLLGSVQLSKIF